ncbi:tetratricopeptide repeat protein, partial [candidate division KSB1 bacterium]
MPQYSWTQAPGSVDLNSLFKHDIRLSFLAGSGISFDYPSCQPTGNQFTKELVTYLIPSEKRQLIKSLTDSEAMDSLGGKFLRFEQFMQHLQKWDPDLQVLKGYATCKDPNANHEVLSRFILADHQVFTTNFDNLLEYGLVKVGVPRNKIIPVIYKEDWHSDAMHDQYQIYKLHGSLLDFRDSSDSRSSVQATIQQIAHGKESTLLLEDWKMKIFKSVLKSNDLVVVGYSGLDDFDILPTLQTIESKRRLIWIDHDNDLTLDNAKIDIITNDDQHQSIRRIDRYLLTLAERCRSPHQIVKIRINTAQFLAWLCERLFSQPNCLKEIRNKCPKFALKLPENLDLSEGQKWYLTGDIFSSFDETESISAFKVAIDHAKNEDSRQLEVESLTYLGRQYDTILDKTSTLSDEYETNWNLALKYYNEAFEISKSLSTTQDRKNDSQALSNIGYLYLNKTDYNKALKYFHQSLEICEKIEDREGKAQNYNNISVAKYNLGLLDEAI